MVTASTYKEFLNLCAGTCVMFGTPVYRDKTYKASKDFYEKNKDQFEMMEEQGKIKEVELGYKTKPFVVERTPDILALEDEPDEDNIFVQQKNASIIGMGKNPAPKREKPQ